MGVTPAPASCGHSCVLGHLHTEMDLRSSPRGSTGGRTQPRVTRRSQAEPGFPPGLVGLRSPLSGGRQAAPRGGGGVPQQPALCASAQTVSVERESRILGACSVRALMLRQKTRAVSFPERTPKRPMKPVKGAHPPGSSGRWHLKPRRRALPTLACQAGWDERGGQDRVRERRQSHPELTQPWWETSGCDHSGSCLSLSPRADREHTLQP